MQMQLCRSSSRSRKVVFFISTHLCTRTSPSPSPCTTSSRSKSSSSSSSSSPSSLSPDKLRLLLSSGLSPALITRLLARPGSSCLSSTSLPNLASKLLLLGPDLIFRFPQLFHLATPDLQRKIDFFASLGFGLVKVGRFGRFGRLLTSKFETLQSRVSYLESIGIGAEDIPKIIRRYPYILAADSEKCIRPAVHFLENERGLSRESICKLVVAHPYFVCLSTQKIAQKVEFFEKLGLDTKSPRFFASVVKLSTVSTGRIQERIDWLVSRGMSREEVITIVERTPTVLGCAQDVTGRKIDYLLNVLNRDIQELLRYPTFLAMSLEQRIKPRFSVMDQLVERGFLQGTFSLTAALSCSDVIFKRRYTDKLCREETTPERLKPGRRKRCSIQDARKGSVG